MPSRKKVYPQVIVLEVMLIAACAAGVYYLAGKAGAPHAVAAFCAGAGLDRALTMLLRHRNKRLLPRMPVTVTRTTKRKPATRRRSA